MNGILESIMNSDVSELQLNNDCFSKSYLYSINGRAQKSLETIRRCKLCKNGSLESYYCQLASLNAFTSKKNYKKSSEVLISIANDESYNFISDNHKESIKNKNLYLMKIGNRSNIDFGDLQAYFKEGRFYYESLMIDTGSVYDTRKECLIILENVKVKYFFGDERPLNYCKGMYKWPALKFSDDIIGILHLNMFKKLVFSKNNEETISTNLFFDNDTIFFNGLVDGYKSNVCIDTGSKRTIVTSKLYKRLYEKISEKPVLRISTRNSSESFYARGKKLDNLIIKTQDFSLKLTNVPILIDPVPWFHCDIIAGSDLVSKYISSIDIKDKKIEIKMD